MLLRMFFRFPVCGLIQELVGLEGLTTVLIFYFLKYISTQVNSLHKFLCYVVFPVLFPFFQTVIIS